MNWILYQLAHSQADWFQKYNKKYEEKIRHFGPFKIHVLKTPSLSKESKKEKIQLQSKQLFKHLKKEDLMILFDVEGKKLCSESFARCLQKWILKEGSKKNLAFVIGGAYGLNQKVKERAHLTLCLSQMTFNHLLAQMIVLEQIYRSLCILRGHPYHYHHNETRRF